MTPRAYASPAAFKQALEQRLQAMSTDGTDFARRRQLVVFDRFLARIARVFGDSATLKGGLVLELRVARARSTTDVDLSVVGSPSGLIGRLQDAGRTDLGDCMKFEVTANSRHPDIKNPGMKYDGFRFRAECRLAGKPFGRPFGVDVAFGDPHFGEPEVLTAADLLGFAGIAPTTIRAYPVETHIAEKLHAYTMPRPRPNTRAKDLPDLALLASSKPLHAGRVRAALEQTFTFRGTHSLPSQLPDPPDEWNSLYAQIADENALGWATIEALLDAVRAFLDPVLAGDFEATWDPIAWTWT